MEISLKELMEGQSTVIRGKEFFETKAYVQPFIDRFSNDTDDFRVRVVAPNQLSISEGGVINQVYNKVLVEAVSPITHDLAEVCGMTYALDVRYPVIKFFKGIKDNMESGHLFIDKSQNIVTDDIIPGEAVNFTKLDALIAQPVNTQEWMEELKRKDFDASNDHVNFSLGQWVRFAININKTTEHGIIKIAYADIVSGYKWVFEDQNSPFYKGLGGHTEYYTIYSAMSSAIYNSRDLVNIPDKTLLLKQILIL